MLLCAQYILPIASEPIRDGAVLVRGNKIEDIGSAELFKLKYPDEEVHDFGLAALMPGFVNLNSHLDTAVLRGIVHDVPYTTWLLSYYKKLRMMKDDDWYESTVFGGLENIYSGVTTVADIALSDQACHALRDVGLRGVVYREVGALERHLVKRNAGLARTAIANWQDETAGSCLAVGVSPASAYRCHPEMYGEVSKLAREMNLPVAMQLASGHQEYEFLRSGTAPQEVYDAGSSFHKVDAGPWMPTGTTPVNYALNWNAFECDNILALHCVCVDEKDVRTLKKYDIAVGICSRMNAQLGMGVAPLDEYILAGLRMGLGTDTPAAVDTTDMMEEMRIGMLVNRSINVNGFLDSKKMLEMATIGGARALHMEDKIGTLEVGKIADVVALDLSGSHQRPMSDPVAAVVNSCYSSDVMMTMVDGKVLYERKEWHVSVDVEKSKHKVMRLRDRLSE